MSGDRVQSVPRSTLVKEEYPHNLLLSIKITTANEIVLPQEITPDILAGIEYSLSTLDNRERDIIRFRFLDRKTYDEIGKVFNISNGRARQIEMKAFRKLREPRRWNYILYGVEGNLKRRSAQEYQKGYNLGYNMGYKDAGIRQSEPPSAPLCSEDVKELPLEALHLSSRSYSCLVRAGYCTVGDIFDIDELDICRIRNFGRISSDEVARKLKEIGIENTSWDKFIIEKE